MSGVEVETCSCAALRQAARHVSRFYDDALAPVGIGVNQFSILARAGRVGPTTVQELAHTLVMDRSTLGHLLRPLEERGLVKLGVSRADRRSRIVTLTRAGRALLAKAAPLWHRAQARFETTFGKQAAATLRGTLKRVAGLDL